MKSRFVTFVALLFALATAAARPAESDSSGKAERQGRTAWFREAKFGMFIHWGIYVIPARGEWVMNKEKMPVAQYAKLAAQFNPVKFNAEQWVRIAKDAGMKYIVITSKHHDGFAMFGSKVSAYNIVDATPFKRDPLKELAAACAKEGIKLGFYYSHAQDWHHPGGAVAKGLSWDPAQNGDFDEYLRTIAIPQIQELLTGYGPVAVLWCDTPWQMTPQRGRKIVEAVRAVSPDTLINSRLMYHGMQIDGLKKDQLDDLREIGVDYLSYRDKQIPDSPHWHDWETCMTLNNSWGYNASDDTWKPSDVLIRHLVEVASKGGNYLLNVGPTPEGVIPEQSARRLKEVGAWLQVNGEAIYGAGPSPFDEERAAATKPVAKRRKGGAESAVAAAWSCTTKPGKLYIHLFVWPKGQFELGGLKDKVAEAYLLADPNRKPLAISQGNGKLAVTLPEQAPDKIDSVLCLELENTLGMK